MGWHSLDYCSVDRSKWQALVNMLMNLWVHKMLGIQPAKNHQLVQKDSGICN